MTLRKLISFGVNPNIHDKDGRQPLLWAASAGSTDAILALVNQGADIHGTDMDGLTALHCTASRGHEDCIGSLITLCGADVNKPDHSGCTPLFYAVTLGHTKVTKTLLDFGALPNVQDKKKRTPAHGGAAKGQLENIKVLSMFKANLWIANAKGNLPFHEAIQSGRKDLVIYFLSQKPEAVEFESSDGKKPLHLAAMVNNTDLCSIFLEYKAEINSICRSTRRRLMTPVDIAFRYGNRRCAKYLQQQGGVPASKIIDKLTLKKALETAIEMKNNDFTEEKKNANDGLAMDSSILNISPVIISSKTSSAKQLSVAQSTRQRFSTSSSDKRSIGSQRLSDLEDSDSDSDYQSFRQRSLRKVNRKKVTSEPNVLQLDTFEDFLGTRRSINELGMLSPKNPRNESRSPFDAYPDLIPSLSNQLPRQMESLNGLQISSNTVSVNESNQEDVHSVRSLLLSRRKNTLTECEGYPAELMQKENETKQESTSKTEKYVFEGSLKVMPYGSNNRKRIGGSFSRSKGSIKSIFQEQKLRRKTQLENALWEETVRLKEVQKGTSKLNEGVVVKRLVKNFNERITHFVGPRTYNGSFTFDSFEEYIYSLISKLNNRKLPVLNRAVSEGQIHAAYSRYGVA